MKSFIKKNIKILLSIFLGIFITMICLIIVMIYPLPNIYNKIKQQQLITSVNDSDYIKNQNIIETSKAIDNPYKTTGNIDYCLGSYYLYIDSDLSPIEFYHNFEQSDSDLKSQTVFPFSSNGGDPLSENKIASIKLFFLDTEMFFYFDEGEQKPIGITMERFYSVTDSSGNFKKVLSIEQYNSIILQIQDIEVHDYLYLVIVEDGTDEGYGLHDWRCKNF